MAIPGPGVAISLNSLAGEFGGSVPHSLSEYYRGGGLVPNSPSNSAVPTSGAIALGNFYGAQNRVPVSLTISSSTYNYDVYANRGPTYVAGSSDITVTVAAPATVGSTSTGTYALLVPSSFNPGDTVTIVNNGVILGMGGSGGAGGYSNAQGAPGTPGGNAIYVNRPTIITNNSVIAGGGGGGGGGRSTTAKVSGGVGGGGAGFNGGAPNGTSTAGGAGGGGSAPGAPGGGRGEAGGTSGATPGGPGSPGGAAGRYITGNSFVTWAATGTRLGGAS